MSGVSKKSVAILMGTFNGARFLEEQLESIAAQTHQNWRLIVSDDGSSDQTLEILLRYQGLWGKERLEVREGPRRGFAHNFLSLASDPNISADFFAFSDQDDVWLPTKLEVAIAHVQANQSRGKPYVYCGRTRYVSENLKPLGESPLFAFPRTFRNALVQSIAGGNTMLFNGAAKSLLEKSAIFEVASHDWWLYLLVEGAGGTVHYDPIPQILYRQHPGSVIGANNSVVARFERIFWLLLGRFKRWNNMQVEALQGLGHLLTQENLETLNEFTRMRKSHLIHRLRMIEVCGLYRQGWKGALSLYLAALFNKI